MNTYRLILIVVLASVGFAQAPKTHEPAPAEPSIKTTPLGPVQSSGEAAAVKPSVVPVITPEQRAKFWRLQTENLQAQANAGKTAAAFQDFLNQMCGADASPVYGPDGEPHCVAKPAPAKVP